MTATRSTARIATEMTRPAIASAARETGPYADGAGHDGQGCEAVCAGVVAVGDKGRRADRVAFTDAVERDEFVAEEADHARRGDEAEVARRLVVRRAGGWLRYRRRSRTG